MYHAPDGSYRDMMSGTPSQMGGDETDAYEKDFQTPKIPRRGSRMSLPGFKHEGGLNGSLLSLPTPNNQKKFKTGR